MNERSRVVRCLLTRIVAVGSIILGHSASPQVTSNAAVHELRVPVAGTSLYVRTIGRGQRTIVLHGGPDFDQAYLLPELDRLQDVLQLIYYDQRGRGRSADNVRASDVTIASELADLDAVRRHFDLDSMIILGHSWGAVLALEYALRHPNRVSSLILMNPAPVSTVGFAHLRESYVAALGPDMERQRQIAASAAYQAADPQTVADRYRIHFRHALVRPEHYEALLDRMRAQFIHQGNDGILRARAVEDQLMRDTWQRADYDLLPKLRALQIPTLVVTGKQDFIPVAIAEEIAESLPNARFTAVDKCGHFAYLECPDEVRKAIEEQLQRTMMKPR